MYISSIKRALRNFRKSEHGTVTLETVFMLPFLFAGMTLSYQLFDTFQFKSNREKATYTITDMLSRETNVVTETYIDNTKVLFDSIAKDNATNQIRASVVRYHRDDDSGINEFELRWSKVRGEGILSELTDADMAAAFDVLPAMIDGQDLIMVQTSSVYNKNFPFFRMDDVPVSTDMFMTLRFAPQLCFTGVCTP